MLEIVADPIPLTANDQGQVMVTGTRIPLDTIVACYHQGDTPEEIVAGFPALSLADVHAVIAYYLRHQSVVDAYLRQGVQAAERLRSAVDDVQGPQPSRADLASRRRAG